MSKLAKEIYRELQSLIPGLEQLKPFEVLSFKADGAAMHLVMLESTPQEINFILSRYEDGQGRFVANPSVHIAVRPKEKTANVKTYKDPDYFHDAVAEQGEVGQMALHQANRFLYEWLKDLKHWNRNMSIHNVQGRSR